MKLFLSICCLLLVGCFGAKYRASSSYHSEGFSDYRVSSNMFKIKFNGNPLSSIQESIDFCMLRCAEVTLDKGFDVFELAYSQSGMYSYLVKNPNLYGEIGGNPIVLEGAYTSQARTPIAENLIICFKEMPTNIYDTSGNRRIFYKAEKVISTIKEKYQL